jgi:tRNA dimethylallyltransferase
LEPEGKNLIIILGPTGIGKSRVSIQLAHKFEGEVINCDSMQVYRGFDIGTDKIPSDRREGIAHHLLDIADPGTQFTAADFVQAALEAAAGIWDRNRLPFITGGTGLYLKALIDGLFPEGKRDPEIRGRLEREARTHGLEPLWERLAKVDPAYAEKIGPRDRIRIIRALEVYMATGLPFSSHFPRTRSRVAGCNLVRIGLHMERQDLCARIDRRVERMFDAGLIDEVRSLRAAGIEEDAPPFRALGYKQVLRHLRQEISAEEAAALTRQETRRYAKRQMTWFRRMEGIRWFAPDELSGMEDHIRRSLKTKD